MDILWIDVNVREEFPEPSQLKYGINICRQPNPHEGVVTLRVVLWKANIFIHIESDDIFEAEAVFVKLYEMLVGWNG